MADLPIADARALVESIAQLAKMADRALPREHGLAQRLRAHLGDDLELVPNTSASFPVMEHANVQLAFNAHEATAGTWEIIGLTPDIGNWGGVSLASLYAGTWHGPAQSVRQYMSVEIGPDDTVACLRAGIVLTELDGHPVAAMVYLSERYLPELVLEVVSNAQASADLFLARIRRLMDEHNVHRGKVMTFAFGRHGEFGMRFARVPAVERDAVVLPERDLAAVEQHAIGIGERGAELIAAGQHVKRGLLLYGPPGTGKTHTVSYLLNRMRGRTTVILTGAAVSAVGQAGTIARSLQPATIVIEDVDLIGMDRDLPGAEHNPMLFQLLNEMDGLSEDADVLFVLTTNRVDMLEPALAARPGRIDQAIEIKLPDAGARRRLIDLYVGVGIDPAVVDRVVARTDGVAPAFIKELARRATLSSLGDGGTVSAGAVSERLEPALDEMLEQSAPVLRRALAAPPS